MVSFTGLLPCAFDYRRVHPRPNRRSRSQQHLRGGPDFPGCRAIPMSHLDESARLTIRAGAMNVLNHANLKSPNPQLTDPVSASFGVATYGRTGYTPGFPGAGSVSRAGSPLRSF